MITNAFNALWDAFPVPLRIPRYAMTTAQINTTLTGSRKNACGATMVVKIAQARGALLRHWEKLSFKIRLLNAQIKDVLNATLKTLPFVQPVVPNSGLIKIFANPVQKGVLIAVIHLLA